MKPLTFLACMLCAHTLCADQVITIAGTAGIPGLATRGLRPFQLILHLPSMVVVPTNVSRLYMAQLSNEADDLIDNSAVLRIGRHSWTNIRGSYRLAFRTYENRAIDFELTLQLAATPGSDRSPVTVPADCATNQSVNLALRFTVAPPASESSSPGVPALPSTGHWTVDEASIGSGPNMLVSERCVTLLPIVDTSLKITYQSTLVLPPLDWLYKPILEPKGPCKRIRGLNLGKFNANIAEAKAILATLGPSYISDGVSIACPGGQLLSPRAASLPDSRQIAAIFIGGAFDDTFRAGSVVQYHRRQEHSFTTSRYFEAGSDNTERAILDFLQTLPPDSSIRIVGHSWGAYTAAVVAAQSKRQVDLLVTVDPVTRQPTNPRTPRQALTALYRAARANSARWISVDAVPLNRNNTDTIASIGGEWGTDHKGYPHDFISAVGMNHGDFVAMMTTPFAEVANRTVESALLAH